MGGSVATGEISNNGLMVALLRVMMMVMIYSACCSYI